MKVLKQHWVFGLILLFSFGLRLVFINGSFWLDEAAQALEVTRPWHLQLKIAEDFQPPALHLWLHLWQYLGTSEWWLRWWGAVLPGLITIIFTYLLGSHLFSKRAGQWASLLLGLSSFHIFYSQELRPYSLPTAFAVLSWYFLVRAIDKNADYKWWPAFGVATLLGMYSSYLYPFLAISQVLFLIWHYRRDLPKLLNPFGVLSAGALAYLPWLPSMLEQLRVSSELSTTLPGWTEVVSITPLKAPVLTFGKFLYGVVDLEISWPYIVMTAWILGLWSWAVWQLSKTNVNKTTQTNLLLLMFWLAGGLVTAWLATFFLPIIRPKRVMYLLPAFYLGAVVPFLLLLAHQKFQKLAQLGLASILAVTIWGSLQYYTQPQYQREDWRSLHQEISEQYPASETVLVFGFYAPFSPWAWYDQGTYATINTDSLVRVPYEQVMEKLQPATEYRYVLVFDYLRDLSDPDRKIDAALQDYGYQEVTTFDRVNIGFVRVFAQPEATLSQQ